MHCFWKPYTSDTTQLIQSLRAQNPNLEAEQRAGRNLLWDRSLDLKQQADFKTARVAQQPYVYQSHGE
ncbi:DUF3460 family protein [Inhella gelatinilytica]|uniref:DUF3460 family protein n=1 Tax=Inhella gelatinilytica TaxID=2795030 RepID=A0A931J1A6_9BURK|nr:DUF3460 family protein [Inhella gelatinilytica]MBH9553531.1 DUF3460 family protein [Inhella gelatinilytica]